MLEQRQTVLDASTGSAVVWLLTREQGSAPAGETVETVTLETGTKTGIGDYIESRVGWVPSHHRDLASVIGQGSITHLAPRGTEFEACHFEATTIGGANYRLEIWRHHTKSGRLTKTLGEMLRKMIRARQSDVVGIPFVWLNRETFTDESTLKLVLDGYTGEDSDASAWREIGSRYLVAFTPWAIIATAAEAPLNRANRVEMAVWDARVRHLLVDPVILASAQSDRTRTFQSELARAYVPPRGKSNAAQSLPSISDAGALRDAFFQWRSRNWWPEPCINPVAREVWTEAARLTHTTGLVEVLSRELVDYAYVETERHNRRIEAQNVRLAWGALAFAIATILLTMAYEFVHDSETLTVSGAAIAVFALVGVAAAVALRRRKTRSIGG